MGSPDTAHRPDPLRASKGPGEEHWSQFDGRDDTASATEVIESCRAYLLLVANQELDPRLRGKIAPSDLVQQTFVNAEEKFSGFRGTSKEELQAWLRRILLNNLIDARRRFCDAAQRSVAREQVPEGDSRVHHGAVDVPADAVSPRASMIAREEIAMMHGAMDRLPADYRRVIVLRSLERRGFAEVGRHMERSEDAARKLWCRAIERLQHELVEPQSDDTGWSNR